ERGEPVGGAGVIDPERGVAERLGLPGGGGDDVGGGAREQRESQSHGDLLERAGGAYHTIRMPTTHRGAPRILPWMCVLTFFYELGFGAVVPALALYARSFGVSQVSVGLSISVY